MLALTFDPGFLWVVLQVAIGLGLLIFVHELGHFVVAKLCGVKCEKFMIGFDIGGLKLSRRWGETVYGIGILPLGGYVKMLGQDDDPSQIADQMEKSQVAAESGDGVEISGPDGKKYVVDRRSYLAKSVPQRMAIISAGVVMNIIFAFIFAVIAYGIGVPYMPCIISHTVAGSPAWQANLRTGDEIVQIADVRRPSFSQLTGKVTLADLEKGLPLVVRRGASGEETSITLKPRQNDGAGLAKIGVASPSSLILSDQLPAVEGSPAAAAEFQAGDEIIRVGDVTVHDFRGLAAELAIHADEPLEVTVRRAGKEVSSNPAVPRTGGQEVSLTVGPNPMKRLGLVMKTASVFAVQPDSPAAQAGIQPGDTILSIDEKPIGAPTTTGESAWDPIALPAKMQQVARNGGTVTLVVRRGQIEDSDVPANDASAEIAIQVTPRVADWLESSVSPGAPVSVPALGITYKLWNEVAAVIPGSPAELAGLEVGDQLTAAKLVIVGPEGNDVESVPIELGDNLNWPLLVGTLQRAPADSKVELRYERSGHTSEVTLSPTSALKDPAYLPERGFNLEPFERIREAHTFGEQLSLGWGETVDSLLLVYRFLQKLFESQVPVTALGGPITIAKAAGFTAAEGLPTFLMFLTMLSANLAVVNFLPIPMLDGGHMVFLAYEGIFRRPANEKFVMALHLAGFAFIIGLMAFLIALDVGLIPRNL